MNKNYSFIPHAHIAVNAATPLGLFEGWRHSIGHGAINCQPLPDQVVEGARKL